jgi:hypothetical protein
MQNGQNQADIHAFKGNNWANTIGAAGQIIGQGIQQHQEQKAQSKRAQAIDQLFSGEQMPDPQSIIRVFGPKDGLDVIKGLSAIHPEAKVNYKDRMEQFRDAARGVRALPPDKQAGGYDFAVKGLVSGGVLKPEEVPPFTPELLEQVASYGQEPAKPVAAKEPKKYEVDVPGPNGTKVKRLVTEEELAGGVQQYVTPPTPKEPREPKEEKLVQIMGPAGQVVWARESEAVGKPAAQAARTPTGQERTALSFYNRAKDASETALKTEESIAKYGLLDQGRLAAGGMAGNFVKNDEMQSYRQAQRGFTEARLRKESGATVKDTEYDQDAKTYWAVPGDSPATIEQKRKAREKVLEGLRIGSGRAYQEYYGEEPPRAGAPAAPAAPAEPQAPTGSPRRVTRAEYEKLASGTRFIAPDGSVRVKP